MFTLSQTTPNITESNLTMEAAITRAAKDAALYYVEGCDLYMYNPIGSDPILLADLLAVLTGPGIQRLHAGQPIQLFIHHKGTTLWTATITES